MKIALIVVGIIVLLIAAGFLFASAGLGAIKKMVIQEVDLSQVPDGVYKGRFHRNRWTYELEVTVRDHQIISIISTNKTPDDFSRKFIEGGSRSDHRQAVR